MRYSDPLQAQLGGAAPSRSTLVRWAVWTPPRSMARIAVHEQEQVVVAANVNISPPR